MSLQLSMRRSRRAGLALVAASATALAGITAITGPSADGATAAAAKPGQSNTVDVQILSFNDFHGHLEATDPNFAGVPAGGVEYLASHVEALRSDQPNSTLTVAAGDLIGGSTFVSGVFQDQPAVESMNELGLDVSSVGNHEFDEGTTELQRMISGGCHPTIGCFKDSNGNDIPYAGADFDYLGANVIDKATGEPFLPPYSVETVDGVKVGFIGMTLEATDSLVSPAGVASVDFVDEVETANKYARILKKQEGVKAIVVLVHEGGFQTGTFNQCVGISGAIVDIASELAPEIDLVVTGHTHQPYVCNIPDPDGVPRMVTSAASFGQVLTETHLPINRASGQVKRMQVVSANHIVTRDVPKDAGETAIVNFWSALSAPLGNRVVGSVATDILGDGVSTASNCRCEETPMSDLVADAILWGTDEPAEGGAQIAFMNNGGVRAPLRFAPSGGEQPGEIMYKEAFDVAPFGNVLVSIDMTGQQIYDVLNQQYQAVPARTSRPMLALGVSEGFTYDWVWDGPAPLPNRQPTVSGHVVPGSAELNGVPLDLNATYRVGTLNFLADGGDVFTAFTNGTNRVGGAEDLANLVEYFGAHPGLTPPPDRVTGL
jgi:5'-nucleotidase